MSESLDNYDMEAVLAEATPSEVAVPKRSFTQRLLLFLGFFMAVALLVVAVGAAIFLRHVRNITFVDVAVTEAPSSGPANWLLVGTDSRDGIDASDPNVGAFIDPSKSVSVADRRTDTIMVFRVNPEVKTIDLVSIPRDLLVEIDGRGLDRVNSAYNTGTEDANPGRNRLIKTVEDNLQIEINHYAEIDFVGFQNIVDTLGGVTLCFDHPTRDVNSGLNIAEAGCPKLDGSQSLAYARSRTYQTFENEAWRTEPSADIGRTERQRNFLKSVAAETMSKASSASLLTVNNVADAAGDSLIVSESASISSIFRLARTFQQVGADNIRTHSLPASSERFEGKSILRLQEVQAQEVLEIFRGSSVFQGVTVAVENGSGISGQANAAADVLRQEGIKVGSVSNASVESDETKVCHGAGLGVAAKSLADLVGGALLEESETCELTLTTGKDFAGAK